MSSPPSRPAKAAGQDRGVRGAEEADMDADLVTTAVRTLRAQGERISVRSVHAIVGGSFRDISKLLREARATPVAGEVASVEGEPEPMPLEPAPERRSAFGPAPPTMRIVAPDIASGYMIINVADFDAQTMTPYEAPPTAGLNPAARPMWLGSTPVCPRCHTALTLGDGPVGCETCGTQVRRPVRGKHGQDLLDAHAEVR
jgi:Plasmid replication region DNA-binding N-term